MLFGFISGNRFFFSLMFFLLVAFSAQAYLNSDALSRYPEIELYEAVQAWLRHDRRRWRHTDTIVQSIRFCLMTPADIFEKVSDTPRSAAGLIGGVHAEVPVSSGENVGVLPVLQAAEAGSGPGARIFPRRQPAAAVGDALQPHSLRPAADRRVQGDDRPQHGEQQDPAAAAAKGDAPPSVWVNDFHQSIY